MKYKLININTKEEKICHKVMVDGFEYYVSDYIKDEVDEELTKIKTDVLHKISIATNNPNIDLPKVIDEVGVLSEIRFIGSDDVNNYNLRFGFKEGYNKAKETYKFTEQDMIDFSEWCRNVAVRETIYGNVEESKNWELRIEQKIVTTKQLLDIWESQKLITIYYQNTP